MASFRYVPAEGQAFSANSTVYPNAKRTFYLTGTNTKSNVYQDSGLTTPHTNPVVADSAGAFPAIYLNQTVTYKVVLQDADDNILDTTDPVKTELGAGLVPLSGLTPAADKFSYFTSSSAAALGDITSYGRQIVAVSNEPAFKELVNLEIGTDVQAYNAYLADIAGISSPASGDVVYFDGANWVAQSLRASANGYSPVRWYIFSTAGADSLIIPHDCFAYLYLIGAGGGGSQGTSGSRRGGGGGELAIKRLQFDASDVITLNIGAGGAAGGTAGDGGTTTAICAAQSLSMSANGGSGGANASGGEGGTGGSGGDYHFDGGSSGAASGSGGGGVDITGQSLADSPATQGGNGGGLPSGLGIPGLISGGPGTGSTNDATDGTAGGNFCGGGGAYDVSSGNTTAGDGGIGGGGGGSRGSVSANGGDGGDGYILIGISEEIT